MNRPSSFIWMVFVLLLLIPTPAGKFLIDLAGGILIIITLLPLIIGGVGWITWKRIKSKVQTCDTCGSSYFNNQVICPECGQSQKTTKDDLGNIPASSATVDIKPEKIN